MGYDLAIRTPENAKDPPPGLVERLIHHLGAKPNQAHPEAGAQGRFVVERPFGKMSVHTASGGRAGLDCTLPEGLTPEETRQFLELLFAAALAENMVLFDPQVGRIVTQADMEVVLAQWRRFNRYKLQTVGSEPSDLLTAGAYYPEYESPARPMTIFWLSVGLLFLLGIFLVRFCT